MLSTSLTQLGLSPEESKVYLAVLELGSSYVSAIASRAKVHRVTCYHTLENLVKKGLISSHIENKITYFTADNPEKFVKISEEKLNIAKGLLPELLSITNKLAYKPKIKFFEGLDGIKNLYEDTLNSKEEILGYSNIESLMGLFPEYLKSYVSRKIEKKIKSRLISPSSEMAFEFVDKYYTDENAKRFIEILFINPHEFNFENEIFIYENKVMIISLNTEELIGILIESNVYARTQRAIYNLAWLGATSFIAR